MKVGGIMLPGINNINERQTSLPSYTYNINRNTNRISGYVNGVEAIVQAVYLKLQTERYESVIYNWYYGSEFDSLIGQNRDYVVSELKRRIREALIEDDRIDDVMDFIISFDKDVANIQFLVITNIGDIVINWEVNL